MGKKKRSKPRPKKKNPRKLTLWEFVLGVLEKTAIAVVSKVVGDLLTELLFKSK